MKLNFRDRRGFLFKIRIMYSTSQRFPKSSVREAYFTILDFHYIAPKARLVLLLLLLKFFLFYIPLFPPSRQKCIKTKKYRKLIVGALRLWITIPCFRLVLSIFVALGKAQSFSLVCLEKLRIVMKKSTLI